ncbi:DUF4233 domain-containing protein [Aeromicrobium sp. CTD01-1L150]|uniref:DUF4233 domain-containing protein n=1 Tax=Aeromicrobium sp. CTD01-1L150 TaxID=3341830 RepID=UPI0035C0DD8F
MRGMCSAMLTFEAILLGLSVPVMISVEDVPASVAAPLGLGLAVLCLLTAGMLRKPWAYGIGHGIQAASIALGLLVPVMFFIGGMFAVLWASAFLLGRRIEADKARWAAQGEGPADA